MAKSLKILAIFLFSFVYPAISFFNPFSYEPRASRSSGSLFQYSPQLITKKIDSSGNPIYTIQAELAMTSDSDQSDEARSFQTNYFMLGLYTSHNILGGSCNNFVKSTCDDVLGCQQVSSNVTDIDIPYSRMDGSIGETALYFDYTYYYNNRVPFVFPETCQGNLGVNASSIPVSGMIGMGINGSSRDIFQSDFPIFSIYLVPPGVYGEIIFGLDYNMIDNSFPSVSLPASEDWRISLDNSFISLGENTTEFTGSVIFDINLDTIGLPSPVYDSIVQWLADEYNVNCTDKMNSGTMVCTLGITYNRLPPIKISTSYGNITIPTGMYMSSNRSPQNQLVYTLNLAKVSKASDIGNKGGSIVEVIEGYENYIILGAPFMMTYYITFQSHSNGPAVHIYKASQNDNFLWIVVIASFAACTLMMVVLIIGFWLKKGSRHSHTHREHVRERRYAHVDNTSRLYSHVQSLREV